MSTKLVRPSNHLILCLLLSSHLQYFAASGSFQMSRFFASGGQSSQYAVWGEWRCLQATAWSSSLMIVLLFLNVSTAIFMSCLDNILIANAHYSRATLLIFPFLLRDQSGWLVTRYYGKRRDSWKLRRQQDLAFVKGECIWFFPTVGIWPWAGCSHLWDIVPVWRLGTVPPLPLLWNHLWPFLFLYFSISTTFMS